MLSMFFFRNHFLGFVIVSLAQPAAAAEWACARYFEAKGPASAAIERFQGLTLSTLNLSLRPGRASDQAAFVRLRRDPRVTALNNERLPTDAGPSADYQSWFGSADVPGGRAYPFIKMLRLRADPAPLGYITGYIKTSNQGLPEASIGYALDPDVWGYGLMREALEKLIEGLAQSGVAKVSGWVFDGNERSERTLGSLGFQKVRLATLTERRQFLMVEERPLYLWTRRLN